MAGNYQFYAATTFENTYHTLMNIVETGTMNQDKEKLSYFVPAVINGAFACELYLKSLNPSTKGHNLKKLYDSLSDGEKEFIDNLMTRTQKEKHGNNYTVDDFHRALEENSDAFVDWRYFYEDDKKCNVDNNFIKDLMAIFRGCVTLEEQGINPSTIDYSHLMI